MANAANYLQMLEILQLTENGPAAAQQHKSQTEAQRLECNISELQNYIKQDLSAVIEQNATELQVPHLIKQIIAEDDPEAVYVLYLQHALLSIVREHNFDSDVKEQLIATRSINNCIEAVQDMATYALRRQLHALLRQSGSVFASDEINEINENKTNNINYALLQLSIEFFARILKIKSFHLANAMELVLRDYMAAIYTRFLAHYLAESTLTDADAAQLRQKLNTIWCNLSKMEYFRNLMLLKGMRQLPPQLQKQLHQELVSRLAAPDGFTTLVATLHTAAAQQSKNIEPKPLAEVVAHIVAFRGHSTRFQHALLAQIFKFLALCLRHKASMADCMGAGLLTLRRLYDLSEANQNFVVNVLNSALLRLTQPADLLSGLIIMEHAEFCDLIELLFHLFCTSAVECLPSSLLIAYLPLLLQLYYHMPELDGGVQKQQIAALVMRCLNNRDAPHALQELVEKLYTSNFDASWLQLHQRVVMLPNAEHSQIILKIAPAEYKQDFSISLALPELLIRAEHHTLTYRVFMSLLKLMQTILEDDSTTAPTSASPIDLLHTEEELLAFLNSKYPAKVEVLFSLNALISHEPLKAQIAENARDFLKFLRQLIEQHIARYEHNTTNAGFDDATSCSAQTLLLVLTLTQEMLEHGTHLPEVFSDFIPALQQLQRQQQANQLIQQRIASLMTLLSGDFKSNAAHKPHAFNAARALIESPESHLQVYGIQLLVDLLRRRDAVTMSNAHIIVALALTTLRSRESYTFLNCVRLFVSLVQTLDATTPVLELLVDEYLNERAEVDFRLVVAEAILKVCKELGPLCYKHKDVLLNCFMNGARSTLDEFRMSSFSNLAQLCGVLSYQVHKFFQELLHLIDCELTTGKYLPAKRAAVLVLGELLSGIDNLMEFEDILLPTYRLLKTIEAAEDCDPKMRLHAANGLKALAEKCHEMLFPAQQLQKDIQILGVHDYPRRAKAHKHILELN